MKRESREARVGLVVTVVPSESVGSDADQAVDQNTRETSPRDN